ncbi:MAG: response regulator, partial [Asticcacaulis sp.]|nr:response regulator [Asticcacaulis sp.]
IRRALEQKTDLAIELRNYRKDGTMFWNALFVSPIFDRNGDLLYFFGSQLDITRRREAEAALRRAQKMEAIGQLTGGIAHDFNNLLQVIIGNVQMARSVIDKPDKLPRYLDSVLQGAQKAKTLTQQLLAFSRKQPLEARIVNLNRVIVELRDLLSKTLGSHVEIELDLAPDVANAQIDVIQLEMAMINILANARDAMPNGGRVTIVTRNVSTSENEAGGTCPGDYVELAICDSGEGMSPEVLAHITEPFFTTKEVGKGTGLGLAQVYGFVKQSDGGFKVESAPGKGTTIRLTFPASGSAVEARAPAVVDEASRPQGKGERILVVEDNKEVRELACAVLEQEGYAVKAAGNAVEALKQLDDELDGVDMLFTDIIMPGSVNGVALAKDVRKLNPDMAILITTGFADDVHGHTNSAEFETIYKPYMPDELARKVRNVLNRKLNHRS